MEKIAWCESRQRQFNIDGTVLRGAINSQDVGYFMINEYYWLDKSIELGYDIYTLKGNKEMAMWIYERQGTTPWNWSKPCWGAE